jgi:hypothetical protein
MSCFVGHKEVMKVLSFQGLNSIPSAYYTPVFLEQHPAK